ncbi:DUF6543 domain-containing protein [Pseudomonas abieticivorans]|uniref:DUF6543 domain-containing protein n=1 Tax=Pseudomonas abieticivorans TaxID=2931382 RepID=UPI0020C184C3|nr:DUF6543 domain-containing protein [Pseudomonas sp. PIA16]
MSPPLKPDIHPDTLREHLAQDLAQALSDGTIDLTSHQRLHTLCSDQLAPTLKVSGVALAGHPGALADALVIIDNGVAPSVLYLHTPVGGLERFSDRNTLHNALRQRRGLLDSTLALTAQPLQGALFAGQSKALLKARVQALDDLAEELAHQPRLPEVLVSLFMQKIGLQQAATLEVPGQLLLQHIEGDRVQRTLTLQQQLLEHYQQQALAPGQSRRWLGTDGKPLAEVAARTFESALVSHADDLHSPYDEALNSYWLAPACGYPRRCDYLAQCLADHYQATLLRQRNDGTLQATALQWLRGLLRADSSVQLEGITLADDVQQPLTLEAMRVIRRTPSATDGYLYSAAHGLQAFTDRDHLCALFQAMNDHLQTPPGLSPDDAISFMSMGTLHLTLTPLREAPFAQWTSALKQRQSHNLLQALGQAQDSTHAVQQALDIRALLDPRLPPAPVRPPLAALQPPPSDAWLSRLDALGDRLNDWQWQQPSLRECAQALLDQHLAALSWPPLKADTLLIKLTGAATAPGQTRLLTDAFLEHVSGCAPLDAQGSGAQLIVADGQRQPMPAKQLDATLLDTLLEHATALLQGRLLRACCPPCPGLYTLFEQALRIESASLRDSQGPAGTSVQLDQVLDLPTAQARQQWGAARVDVHRLDLVLNGNLLIPLQGCFVAQTATAEQGPVTLWSPATGLQPLPSLTLLRSRLLNDLQHQHYRESVLSLAVEAQRSLLRDALTHASPPTLSVQTHAIRGNLIQALLDGRQRWVRSAVDCAWSQALGGHFDAQLFDNLITHSLQGDSVQPDLEYLQGSVKNNELQRTLPQWARDTTPEQQQRYAGLLSECLEVQTPANYYLDGIPDLKQFTLEKLQQALAQEHDTLDLDLDQVRIAFKTNLTITLNLVDAALKQFNGSRSAVASVSLANGIAPPAWLTPELIIEQMRTLDLGKQYLELLTPLLQPTDPRYSERKQLYGRTLCAQLRELGFRKLLQQQLTPTAYSYLDNVLSMPDGLARQPVNGQEIVLRQVRLIPQAGMKPDPVSGMYLIGPRNVEQGPVLLLATYSKDFGLLEFSDQKDFLDHARSNETLASLMVWRLEDGARRIYDKGGLKAPHLPWSAGSSLDLPVPTPAQLDDDPVLGNALTFLFDDNLHLLQMMARQQTAGCGEADWEAFITLGTRCLEQASLFLPGELGLMVSTWQSDQLLRCGVKPTLEDNWGEALAAFCAALAHLAAHRRAAAAVDRPALVLPMRAPVRALSSVMPSSSFEGRHPQLPVEFKARLLPFEQVHQALSGLRKDPLTQLYTLHGVAPCYAAVAGKVYQVQSLGKYWYIVQNQRRGPRIRLNLLKDWELDINWGRRRRGGELSREEAKLDSYIDDLLQPQAEGMGEIHRHFNLEGQQVKLAHRLALDYLRNCLQNLNAAQGERPLAAPTLRILNQYLNAGPITPTVLLQLRTRARKIYSALLAPSLNPVTSPRIILGRSKRPKLNLIAFTAHDDPARRIFLTERFFLAPSWMFQHSQSGFDVTTHYQASTLIHELSHQEIETLDIAYLESAAPFTDQMATTPAARKLTAETERLQLRKLSVDTPPHELFTLPSDGQPRDVMGDAAKQILKICDRATLDEAREDFYSDPQKRLAIILANADSLTLLFTLLGRSVFT